MWHNMGHRRKIFFKRRGDKGVGSLDHIFNAESAKAQRHTPEMPQRWQSKHSKSISFTGAILRKMLERLPAQIGRFTDLHKITPAPVILSLDTTDQPNYTHTCRESRMLSPIDGQVSRCHLSPFFVMSPENRIVVQAGSTYGEVKDTRFDELHFTQGDLVVVTSTYRHHGMPPPPNGLPRQGLEDLPSEGQGGVVLPFGNAQFPKHDHVTSQGESDKVVHTVHL